MVIEECFNLPAAASHFNRHTHINHTARPHRTGPSSQFSIQFLYKKYSHAEQKKVVKWVFKLITVIHAVKISK